MAVQKELCSGMRVRGSHALRKRRKPLLSGARQGYLILKLWAYFFLIATVLEAPSSPTRSQEAGANTIVYLFLQVYWHRMLHRLEQ